MFANISDGFSRLGQQRDSAVFRLQLAEVVWNCIPGRKPHTAGLTTAIAISSLELPYPETLQFISTFNIQSMVSLKVAVLSNRS